MVFFCFLYKIWSSEIHYYKQLNHLSSPHLLYCLSTRIRWDHRFWGPAIDFEWLKHHWKILPIPLWASNSENCLIFFSTFCSKPKIPQPCMFVGEEDSGTERKIHSTIFYSLVQHFSKPKRNTMNWFSTIERISIFCRRGRNTGFLSTTILSSHKYTLSNVG